MLSTPEATTRSYAPAISPWAAKWMDCCDEPHWRSMVVAGTSESQPLGRLCRLPGLAAKQRTGRQLSRGGRRPMNVLPSVLDLNQRPDARWRTDGDHEIAPRDGALALHELADRPDGVDDGRSRRIGCEGAERLEWSRARGAWPMGTFATTLFSSVSIAATASPFSRPM